MFLPRGQVGSLRADLVYLDRIKKYVTIWEGPGCPERLGAALAWSGQSQSNLTLIRSSPSFEQRVGSDDLQRSLPVWSALWDHKAHMSLQRTLMANLERRGDLGRLQLKTQNWKQTSVGQGNHGLGYTHSRREILDSSLPQLFLYPVFSWSLSLEQGGEKYAKSSQNLAHGSWTLLRIQQEICPA